MGFDMSNATNARSTVGLKKLISNYESDIAKVVKEVRGAKYQELKKTITSYWQGADCEFFIKQLDSTISEAEKKIRGLSSQITDALTKEALDFDRFQRDNRV